MGEAERMAMMLKASLMPGYNETSIVISMVNVDVEP
jgi:hypothetical protein